MTFPPVLISVAEDMPTSCFHFGAQNSSGYLESTYSCHFCIKAVSHRILWNRHLLYIKEIHLQLTLLELEIGEMLLKFQCLFAKKKNPHLYIQQRNKLIPITCIMWIKPKLKNVSVQPLVLSA